MYWGKDSLDLVVFSEPFDREFWDDEVVPWIRAQSEYQRSGDLPPDDPRYSWECEYCPYANRCGKTSEPFQDVGSDGFLTLFEYPQQRVAEYLQADESAELTPTLAVLYPSLREKVDVANWTCPVCDFTAIWDSMEWDGDVDSPPVCPDCIENEDLVLLRGDVDY